MAQTAQQPIAAEPRGAQDVPLDASVQAGQMELMASARAGGTDLFEGLTQEFVTMLGKRAAKGLSSETTASSTLVMRAVGHERAARLNTAQRQIARPVHTGSLCESSRCRLIPPRYSRS